MGQPITDSESMSEHPFSFDPRMPSDEGDTSTPTALLQFPDPREVIKVEDFVVLEAVGQAVRVWYEEPGPDTSNYVTYADANIVEVRL